MLTILRRLVTILSSAAAIYGAAQTFAVDGNHFALNCKPFQIISGEMHYQRVPRAYWRDRFRMARAMGLNAITTYVFWNVHQPRPDAYDFSGNNDVAEFVKEAQQEGLYVILRPGPYVCAEWEFGGFPAWLLKDRSIIVRSRDAKFMNLTQTWMKRLGQELAPLQIGNGGNIIAVQVENEYGSFGNDHQYMQQIHHMLLEAGFNRSLLYTADGPEQVPNGSLPDLAVGINFGGSDNAAVAFETLKKYRPNGPFLNSEFWDGWFDHWGSKHAKTDSTKEANNLKWMLEHGYSVSLYMFHGGTSFGWMNGANSDGKSYEPDVTSYDYDSPLDESGRPTSKFYLFRDLIQKATGVTPPDVPAVKAPISLPPMALTESASLWDSLPAPVHSDKPLSMEDLDQAYGYILYRTTIALPITGELVLEDLHDYAQIYLNGKVVGTLDRRLSQNHMNLAVTEANSKLDILVENSGRVNFTTALRGERKGITKQVTLANRIVSGWDIFPLPMADFSKTPFVTGKPCTDACFYRAKFTVDAPGDTFLDTSHFIKGQVWINGQPLGRIWNVGPQKALYLPGPWLKQGENEVVVFDLDGAANRTLQGLTIPKLGN